MNFTCVKIIVKISRDCTRLISSCWIAWGFLAVLFFRKSDMVKRRGSAENTFLRGKDKTLERKEDYVKRKTGKRTRIFKK